jgi:hypothetical protein
LWEWINAAKKGDAVAMKVLINRTLSVISDASQPRLEAEIEAGTGPEQRGPEEETATPLPSHHRQVESGGGGDKVEEDSFTHPLLNAFTVPYLL